MKAIAFLKKRDDLSFDDFARHLTNEHVRFMRAVPGLDRWASRKPLAAPHPAKRGTDNWSNRRRPPPTSPSTPEDTTPATKPNTPNSVCAPAEVAVRSPRRHSESVAELALRSAC